VMRQVQFESSYSFMFSARPDTPAADLPNQVPIEIKQRRLQELQSLQAEITERALASWIGKEVEILLDGFTKADPTKLQGRTSQNLLVHLNQEEVSIGPGMIIKANIIEASRHTLRGEYVV
ncbi:MAG: TRAM domain-containing protein, partial [Bdellovibrionales bacterium]|nr:TRAM domain-containing protein [Bdellovibrionales bacterium]